MSTKNLTEWKVLLKMTERKKEDEEKNSEEDESELEKVIFEHYKDIFGEKSILFPKQKMKT